MADDESIRGVVEVEPKRLVNVRTPWPPSRLTAGSKVGRIVLEGEGGGYGPRVVNIAWKTIHEIAKGSCEWGGGSRRSGRRKDEEEGADNNTEEGDDE